MEKNDRQKEIFEKYLLGQESSDEFMQIEELLAEESKNIDSFDIESSFQQVKLRLDHQIYRKKKNVWFTFSRGMVAAAILLLTIGVAFYLSQHTTVQKLTDDELIAITPSEQSITISFGNTELDVVKNMDSVQLELGLNKAESEELDLSNVKVATQGKIYVPKGKMFHFTLSDGSKVWLNANSTLIFPTKFDDKQRIVELDGEAYFEVTKNANAKFIVKSSQQKIEVLGTKFNISTVGDKSVTVLLEGKVNVSAAGGASKLMKPDEMTVVDDNSLKTYSVNAEDFITWKDGFFSFNNASQKDILISIARWYDFETDLDQANNSERFTGKIPVTTSMSDIKSILKSVGIEINLYKEKQKIIISK